MATSPSDRPHRDHAPRRQFDRQAKPALILTQCQTLKLAAKAVHRRIRQTLHSRGVGSVVAVDPFGALYVLPAGEPRTDRVYREHFAWVVGVYAEAPANGSNASVPEEAQLLDDLAHHLTEAMGQPAPDGRGSLLSPEDQLALDFPPLNRARGAA